jgi:hypothetical protein
MREPVSARSFPYNWECAGKKSLFDHMTHQTVPLVIPKNSGASRRFPVTDFWEEMLDIWEENVPQDPLGADHADRFEAIRVGIRSVQLGPDAGWAIRAMAWGTGPQ